MKESLRARVENPGWRVTAAMLLGSLALLPAACPTMATTPIQDHLSVIQQLGEGMASELLDELAFPAGTVVYLVPETPHTANWFVGGILARALCERGYRVVDGGLTIGSDAVVSPSLPADSATTEPLEPLGTQREEERRGDEWADDTEAGEAGLGDGDSELLEEGSAEDDEQDDEQEVEGLDQETGEEQPPARRFQGPQQRAGETQGAGAPSDGRPPAQPFKLQLPECGEVLAFRLVDFGVSYPWCKRKWLIGPRQYGRLASVRVSARRLVQPGQVVEAVAQSARVQIDEFPGKMRSYLEGNEYPFAIPEPEHKSMERIIEPVFVGAIVAGLVYLFYQNQK